MFDEEVTKYEEAEPSQVTAPTLNVILGDETEVEIITVKSDDTTVAAPKKL